MTRPRYKRSPGEHTAEETEVPVVLPHVIMEVAEDGTMTLTVDGVPYLPEPLAPPWRRDSFATVLDRLTEQRRSPVRVEVREADGRVFTDIITPSRRRAAPEPPAKAAVPVLPVLFGDGFVPGEDVAVAVVIAHGDAAPDGTMRGLIEAAQLAATPTREVILLGRLSGTMTIGHPE